MLICLVAAGIRGAKHQSRCHPASHLTTAAAPPCCTASGRRGRVTALAPLVLSDPAAITRAAARLSFFLSAPPRRPRPYSPGAGARSSVSVIAHGMHLRTCAAPGRAGSSASKRACIDAHPRNPQRPRPRRDQARCFKRTACQRLSAQLAALDCHAALARPADSSVAPRAAAPPDRRARSSAQHLDRLSAVMARHLIAVALLLLAACLAPRLPPRACPRRSLPCRRRGTGQLHHVFHNILHVQRRRGHGPWPLHWHRHGDHQRRQDHVHHRRRQGRGHCEPELHHRRHHVRCGVPHPRHPLAGLHCQRDKYKQQADGNGCRVRQHQRHPQTARVSVQLHHSFCRCADPQAHVRHQRLCAGPAGHRRRCANHVLRCGWRLRLLLVPQRADWRHLHRLLL